MITVRGRLFVAVLLAALLSAVFAVPASASEDQTSAGFETVLRGTNDYRELNGVDRLVHDPRMSAVAQAWAERMASDFAAAFAADTNPDRQAAMQAALADAFRHNPLMAYQVPAGWESVGENIALNGGHLDPYAYLLTQWRNSPGHNANMLNERWTHIGVGTYQDDLGITWGVQVFGDYGSPASIPDPAHAVVDLDNIPYSGTVSCVVLLNVPSGSEFFRQCGPRPGNVYTFSDVPPGTYSTTLLAAGGGVLYSGWPTYATPPTVSGTADSASISAGGSAGATVTVDPAASGSAYLQYLKGSVWTTFSPALVLSSGSTHFSWVPSQTYQYCAVFGSTLSDPFTVAVAAPTVSGTADSASIAAGGSAGATVTVDPAASGSAYLQYLRGSVWTTFSPALALSSGSTHFSWVPSQTYQYRAVFGSTISDQFTVTVGVGA